VAKSIDVSDLNIYYGHFLAVEDVSIDIGRPLGDAFIGPRAAASRRSCAR
jgi:phosphate transport system ATP-binding protein